MTRPELTIVVPTYNEAGIIIASLTRVALALGNVRPQTEIIVADDGSDDLPEVISRDGGALGFGSIRVVRNGTRLGKGISVAEAFKSAQGVIAGFIDIDLSVDPEFILPAVKKLREGNDICIARRVGNRWKTDPSFMTSVAATGFAVFHRYALFGFGRSFSDTQCGFKFFSNAAAKDLYSGLVARDGLTDLEVLLKAVRAGYKIAEIDVPRRNDRIGKRNLSSIFVGETLSLLRIFSKYRLGV